MSSRPAFSMRSLRSSALRVFSGIHGSAPSTPISPLSFPVQSSRIFRANDAVPGILAFSMRSANAASFVTDCSPSHRPTSFGRQVPKADPGRGRDPVSTDGVADPGCHHGIRWSSSVQSDRSCVICDSSRHGFSRHEPATVRIVRARFPRCESCPGRGGRSGPGSGTSIRRPGVAGRSGR